MDKSLLNHQIVSMRNLIRKSKISVTNSLVRELRILDKRLEKSPNDKKIINKISNKKEEINMVDDIANDLVARKALERTESWKSVISDPKVSSEGRVIARIASFKPVQLFVSKFREENPYWESWIGPQLELWDEIRSIKHKELKSKGSDKTKHNKDIQDGNTSKIQQEPVIKRLNVDLPTSQKHIEESLSNEDSGFALPVKRTLSKKKFPKDSLPPVPTTQQSQSDDLNENDKLPFGGDTFFLSADAKIEPFQRPLEIDVELAQDRPSYYRKNVMQRKDVSSLPLARRDRREAKSSDKGMKRNKTQRTDFQRSANTGQNYKKQSVLDNAGSLHPSWEAKRRAKEMSSISINLNGPSVSKKIKFTDDD